MKPKKPKRPKLPRPHNQVLAFENALRVARLDPDALAILQARHPDLAQKLITRAARMQ